MVKKLLCNNYRFCLYINKKNYVMKFDTDIDLM